MRLEIGDKRRKKGKEHPVLQSSVSGLFSEPYSLFPDPRSPILDP